MSRQRGALRASLSRRWAPDYLPVKGVRIRTFLVRPGRRAAHIRINLITMRRGQEESARTCLSAPQSRDVTRGDSGDSIKRFHLRNVAWKSLVPFSTLANAWTGPYFDLIPRTSRRMDAHANDQLLVGSELQKLSKHHRLPGVWWAIC